MNLGREPLMLHKFIRLSGAVPMLFSNSEHHFQDIRPRRERSQKGVAPLCVDSCIHLGICVIHSFLHLFNQLISHTYHPCDHPFQYFIHYLRRPFLRYLFYQSALD